MQLSQAKMAELKIFKGDAVLIKGKKRKETLVVALVDNNTITAAAGKEVFAQLLVNGGDPATIVAAQGLQQVSDPAQLQPIIAQVIAANSAKAEQYRRGKTGLLGFFVGQAMRESVGKANPQLPMSRLAKMLHALPKKTGSLRATPR